jgi:hypothetical protein
VQEVLCSVFQPVSPFIVVETTVLIGLCSRCKSVSGVGVL